MKDLISVITLTHNKLDYSRKCLGSLLGTDYLPWELVVVDNGSTDGTREWLDVFRAEASGAGVKVTMVLNDDNIGCSTARNQGLARARGAWVVFMDNDVALRSRGWLTRLRAALESDAKAGLAGPKLVYPYDPYAIQCAGAAVSRSGRVQFIGRGERREDARFQTAGEVQWVISACCMGRRSIIEKAGGFDEAFNPIEYEDADLCYRLRSRGMVVLYVPGVEMYHFESVTSAGTANLPNTYLIIKHGLLFQKRWRHMFEKENGPDDSACRWKWIEPRSLSAIGAQPVVE